MRSQNRQIGWMKIVLLLCLISSSACWADETIEGPAGSLVFAGWRQSRQAMRLPNHCSYDPTHGYYFCSNHCGADYEFYVCSPRSFGCCRIGVGYCDYLGFLRCRR
jgi:hypothetical protein